MKLVVTDPAKQTTDSVLIKYLESICDAASTRTGNVLYWFRFDAIKAISAGAPLDLTLNCWQR